MKMTLQSDHVIFELPATGTGSCVLLVVDDYWKETIRMYEKLESGGFTEASWTQHIDTMGGDSVHGVTRLGVAMLPVIAYQMGGLSQLLVGSFGGTKSEGWVHRALKRNEASRDMAFLIDLNDTNLGVVGEEVAQDLLSLGVQSWRMAYFSVGSRSRKKVILETITKDQLDTMGLQRLSNWLSRVQGRIGSNYLLFKNNLPHNPSNLTDSSVIDQLARNPHLGQLAECDKYGVWSWVRQTLCDSKEVGECQYNYLCGKGFLRAAEDYNFPYVALRALLFGGGLIFGVPAVETKKVRPDEEDLDNDLCFGRCSILDGVTFEAFATALRNFIEKFHGDTKGKVRVTRISVATLLKEIKVCLDLSERLPVSIGQLKGKGLVTEAYAKLSGCFKKPLFSLQNNGKRIQMKFIPDDDYKVSVRQLRV